MATQWVFEQLHGNPVVIFQYILNHLSNQQLHVNPAVARATAWQPSCIFFLVKTT